MDCSRRVPTECHAFGVWRSWQDCRDFLRPVAICTTVESAEAARRLCGGWREPYVWTGTRPWLAEDQAKVDAEEAEWRRGQDEYNLYGDCGKGCEWCGSNWHASFQCSSMQPDRADA